MNNSLREKLSGGEIRRLTDEIRGDDKDRDATAKASAILSTAAELVEQSLAPEAFDALSGDDYARALRAKFDAARRTAAEALAYPR